MNHPIKPPADSGKEFNEDAFEDSELFENFINSTFIDTTKQNESSSNIDGDNSALNVSALCCDEEISGYDKLTGQNWIYPTNYPVRDYQLNIVRSSLFKNTLVSLPTGLGKTFIAAVVMYNFFRWYPLGKIVFTAPTRPLVAQQIEACYNIVAIPPKDTIEMTGHMPVTTRKSHWQNKRVVFATPQVIYNDIKSGICPGEKLRCLVVDEAHRARGNYAYCQIISSLTDMGHTTYRVLALSATPGSKVDDVIHVVNNLHIAHLELRTDNCIDVRRYSHTRNINIEIIQLDLELTILRKEYVEIIDQYTRRLTQLNILPQNVGNLSKGRVVMLYKEFQNRDRSSRHPQHSHIMKDFTVLISLFHALELLIRHGSRVFLNFFDEHPEKSWIQNDDQLTRLLERLRDDLGINPLSLDRSVLPDGTIPEIPKDLTFGHPKFDKLKEIMLEHFTTAQKKGEDTRAIVFCEYRESVNLVHCLLLQCRPLIRPQMFVGQGASGREGGTTQRAQARAVRAFREGGANALVSTCVAEEGLDVGAVDLCVCFDVATRSPVRLVQRCGRTGRARGGHVYILVTEGKEHQTLMDCMRQRDGLNTKILQSKEVHNNLFKNNPRMLPRDFTPQCKKMFITVKPVNINEKTDTDKPKKGQKDLRSMLLGGPSTSSSSTSSIDAPSHVLTKQEFDDLYPDAYKEVNVLAEPTEYWSMSKERIRELGKSDQPRLNLSTWLEWQRTLQTTVNIGHSADSQILVDILKYSDAKRFEALPATQTQDLPEFLEPSTSTKPLTPVNSTKESNAKALSPVKSKTSNKRKQKLPLKSPGKKDGDIRALFSTATKSTRNYTKLINDLGIQNTGGLTTQLISLLVDLSLENTNITKSCYICSTICNCKVIQEIRNLRKPINVVLPTTSAPKLPDINLIDDFDANLIAVCNKSITEISYGNKDEVGASKKENFELDLDLIQIDTKYVKDNTKNINDIKTDKNFDKNFDLGDIDDIFADSNPEETSNQDVNTKDPNSSNPKETLGFFGLDSIDDIFADSDDDRQEIKEKPNDNEKLKCSTPSAPITKDEVPHLENTELNNLATSVCSPRSPSLLSGRCMASPSASTSPILCSQVRKFQLSTKRKKDNKSTPVTNSKRNLSLSFTNISLPSTSKLVSTFADKKDTSKEKSMLTITQLVEMINDKNEHSVSKISNVSKEAFQTSHKERSPSPILLTQKDKTFINTNNVKKTAPRNIPSQTNRPESLIILDSDSDSNEATQEYEVNDSKIVSKVDKNPSPPSDENLNIRSNKRKFDDDDIITNSPFFAKKPKVTTASSDKPLTLQEKVLAALNCKKVEPIPEDKDKTVNFMALSPILSSQKENLNPISKTIENRTVDRNEEKYNTNPKLQMLQMFKRTKHANNRSPKIEFTKKRICFDSDDDFADSDKFPKIRQSQKSQTQSQKRSHKPNGNVNKVRRTAAQFIDDEADLSDDGDVRSGDELSDESIGSIIDFICDEMPNEDDTAVDMQAIYMKSVKSPVKGVFKIPELPKTFNNNDILSQAVEEDTYVMDSFCVDSHIGLTQVNDVSELEIAEMILEEKKKRRKKRDKQQDESCDSPLVRRKVVRRKIASDSESD
ncbi:Fanconi anemia group M protein [Aricia agestis]|uniref:Fanconi anemia group M protein n=1 Tax=Aricia agestis TaxID=91739 RepID=UPI001C208789|nr:Fanconi anemia group M protein [Aricia agestis]